MLSEQSLSDSLGVYCLVGPQPIPTLRVALHLYMADGVAACWNYMCLLYVFCVLLGYRTKGVLRKAVTCCPLGSWASRTVVLLP